MATKRREDEQKRMMLSLRTVLYDAIVEIAKRERRSPTQQIVYLLERAVMSEDNQGEGQ